MHIGPPWSVILILGPHPHKHICRIIERIKMEPEVGESFNSASIDNILVWACPSVATFGNNSEENLYPPSLNQRRRASFATKHPLLAKLEEAEEDVKHSDYTAHLLIQQQTREYAFTVENAIILLKKGTEQIIDSLTYWQSSENEEDDEEGYKTSYPSWVKAASGIVGEDDISHVGRDIVTISEVIKAVQDEDALTFWACEERQLIWNLLVSASREMVKLRRKLNRIKESLEDRVRNVRRVAILCECEITGNFVPSEIYYQWVNEDAKTNQYKNKSKLSMQKSDNQRLKTKLDLFKEAAFKLIRSNKHDNTMSDDTEVSTISTLFAAPLRLYPQKQYAKKLEATNISNVTLEEREDKDKLQQSMSSKVPLDEAWSPKPSVRLMELITSNLGPPPKFSSAAFLFDNEESPSRIREDESNLNEFYCLNSADLAILIDHQNASTSQKDSRSVDNNNPRKNEEINEEDERNNDTESPPSTSQMSRPLSQKNLLSETMKRQIFIAEKTCNSLREIVSQTTWAIRETERMWLCPPDSLIKSRKTLPRELYKQLEFIVDTAKLTETPAFASRIYPEDKHEIIAVLDPVLRELTNCYMSIYVLHNLVVVDTNYLKQLVSRFPKGNLVDKDWMNDPSNDADSEGIEMSPEEYDVDVDELFQ